MKKDFPVRKCFDDLHESSTLAINKKCSQLRAAGTTVYSLGLGQSPFPVPVAVVEELQAHAHEKDYLPVEGLPALREAIAQYHTRHEGRDVAGADVIIGPGSKELLFILQFVFSGDVIIPTPSWVTYVPQATMVGKKVHLLHTAFEKRWRITPDQIETLYKEYPDTGTPRMLILTYPNNPDGLTYTEEELRALAQVARKHNIIIVSDEIYGGIDHDGSHVSIARFYPEGTIVSTGLSKWCGAGGWRLGAFIFPKELQWLMKPMITIASETFTSVSAPIQYAALRAFGEHPDIDDYCRHSRRILAALGSVCANILQKGGANVHAPEGGFYLFPDFSGLREQLKERGITTSKELADVLLQETQVAVLPGSDFNRPDDELTVRIAYVNFDGGKALEASYAIPLDEPLPEAFIETYCADTLEAVRRIQTWLM